MSARWTTVLRAVRLRARFAAKPPGETHMAKKTNLRIAHVFSVLLFVLLPSVAFAYPTAIVFTPTGEAKPLGTVSAFAYIGLNLSPTISPGSNWLGVQVGVLPQFEYGKGLRFGGLELGFDVITPYGARIVKPVLNAKLGLVTEGTFSPSIAVGLVELSPALPTMNFVYVSMTKSLQFGEGPSFGRLTLGLGFNAGDRSQFTATFPFNGTRLAFMAAFETPMIANRIGFFVDHLGGGSEIGSTYAGASLMILSATMIQVGAYIANERSMPATTYDGFFACLMTSFDTLAFFRERRVAHP